MKLKVVLTGATGMVGEGVLLECLANASVEKVLVVGRRSCGREHPKLEEIVHADLFDLAPIQARFAGYNACFFCLGTSSVGMTDEAYHRVTYDLTMGFAHAFEKVSPDVAFCFVSGASTDSSGQGLVAWARIKGATENSLLKLLKNAVMFRPGAMKPTDGQRNVKPLYRAVGWLYPVGRLIFPGSFSTLQQVAQAMIHAAEGRAPKRILEVSDIVALANSK